MASHKTAIEIAASLFLLGLWTSPAVAEPTALARPKMLVYGNYCGLGNNAPLPPIDALDAACARHDDCTPDDGLPTKACNLRLEQEATALANDPRQADEARTMAGFVAAFASTNPSTAVADAAPVSVPTAKPPAAFAILRSGRARRPGQ